jgi:two-component system OmpR family response regulator
MSIVTYLAVPNAGNITYVLGWPCTTYGSATPPLARPIALVPPEQRQSPARSRSKGRASAVAQTIVRFSGWELDLIERRLTAPGGGTHRIPGLEFALLKAFLDYARQPVSRADLANLLARGGNVRLSGRTVDSYVSRLRRRLGRAGSMSLISTVWNMGYRFDADVLRN